MRRPCLPGLEAAAEAQTARQHTASLPAVCGGSSSGGIRLQAAAQELGKRQGDRVPAG